MTEQEKLAAIHSCIGIPEQLIKERAIVPFEVGQTVYLFVKEKGGQVQIVKDVVSSLVEKKRSYSGVITCYYQFNLTKFCNGDSSAFELKDLGFTVDDLFEKARFRFVAQVQIETVKREMETF